MKKQACALVAAIVLLAAPALGQGWNVDRIGESYQTWYGVTTIAQQGSYVYLRAGNGGLSIVDISDPEDPIEVAYVLDDYAINDIEVAANYVYVGVSYGGLVILDVSTPANPAVVAQFYPPRIVNNVCVIGNFAFLIYPLQPQGAGMYILDVTDPTQPETICQYILEGNAADPTVVDSLLYLPMRDGGLWIFDISNPSNPIQLGSISIAGGYCYGVAVADGIAYLPMTMNGLAILDVSDPTRPTPLAQVTFDSWTRVIDVSGNLAYAGTDRDGLYILDVSQPSTPVILGNYAGPYPHGILSDLVVEGATVYGAWNEIHFRITDVSDPQNPTEISSYYANWSVQDVAWQGNYVYLAAGNEGLLINDVSNPENPWQVAYLDDIGSISGVLLLGNYAYMQTNSSGTKIVDISDPAHPSLAGTYPLQGRILRIVGNLAYAEGTPDLQILDVSSPLLPVQIGSYDLPQGSIGKLDTDGRFLYAVVYYECNSTSVDSLLVLDVNDPANPQLMDQYALGGYNHMHLLALGDGYLYVSGTDNGFRVYDISDPTQLIQVGQLTLPLQPGDMLVDGDFVYVACEGYSVSGPRIIDVSDPTNPVLTGYYMAPAAYSQKLAIHDDYACFTEDGHLVVYDCSDATHNDLEVSIVPFIQPIQIPASGGSFDFYLFADNSGPGNQTVDLWTKAILPGGSALSPIMGPVSVSLDSGTTGWIRHQNVPGRAPAGLYTYIACTGDYPNQVWASDSLQFTKLGSGDWGSGYGDWSNTGESFEIANDEFLIPHSSFIVSARPNPFNPTTALSYELRAASFVKLGVYDISGRLVVTLVDGWREAGTHEVMFYGAGLAAGIYLYRLELSGSGATPTTECEKMVLMK